VAKNLQDILETITAANQVRHQLNTVNQLTWVGHLPSIVVTCAIREPLEISGTVFTGWTPLQSSIQESRITEGILKDCTDSSNGKTSTALILSCFTAGKGHFQLGGASLDC